MHDELLCKDDGVDKIIVIDYMILVESLMFLINTKLDKSYGFSLI